MSYQLPYSPYLVIEHVSEIEAEHFTVYKAQQLQDAYTKGREAGLEEAANKAENASSTADGADIAEAIRALIKKGRNDFCNKA